MVPTYVNLMRLVLSSEIRKCASIKVHHAWFDERSYICEPFDQRTMPVGRVPPGDMRADGKRFLWWSTSSSKFVSV